MSSLNASKRSKPAKNLNKKQNTSAICAPANSKQSSKKSVSVKSTKPANSKTTKIVVKCNCGFSNKLFLRGEGISGLNWDKGILMKCTKADEWIWETNKPFNHAEVKILLNDKEYEVGENHDIECGKAISFTPKF
jgi:hypothetical protein